MVYQDYLVVDAVSHAYNHSEENYRNDVARHFDEETYHLAAGLSPDGWEIPAEHYFKDQQIDELGRLLFLESDIDYTIFHSTAITDYFYDGYNALDKAIEFRENNPERVSAYGSVDPLAEDVLDEVERQANELDVDGIKLYPVRYEDGRSLSVQLNDYDTVWPVLERAADLGVNTIAVHKAIPFGYGEMDNYKLGDIDEAASSFPEINFEIVHAGYSFLEETVWLMARFENVYANFEVTSNLVTAQPKKFAEIMGEMLYYAGPEQILFATGATFTHPQPMIEAFADFEMPDELQNNYGYPEVTDEMKEKILGLNALEMLGEDPENIREQVSDDKWSNRSEEDHSSIQPWSTMNENTLSRDIGAASD